MQNTAPAPVGLPFPDEQDEDKPATHQRDVDVDSTSEYYNYSRVVAPSAPEEHVVRDDLRDDIGFARMGGEVVPSAPPLESADDAVDKAPQYARI